MIRALIADDEELSLRALHQMLRRHADVEVVAECRDGDEAREALEAHRPDVAFLDIRMPLASGLDLALSRDRGVQTLVVFVTAFDQFALPAFDADAADYLTKPLTEARFDAAIETDIREGTGVGVSSTPTFVVNGQPVLGAQPLDTFTSVIDAAADAAHD